MYKYAAPLQPPGVLGEFDCGVIFKGGGEEGSIPLCQEMAVVAIGDGIICVVINIPDSSEFYHPTNQGIMG